MIHDDLIRPQLYPCHDSRAHKTCICCDLTVSLEFKLEQKILFIGFPLWAPELFVQKVPIALSMLAWLGWHPHLSLWRPYSTHTTGSYPLCDIRGCIQLYICIWLVLSNTSEIHTNTVMPSSQTQYWFIGDNIISSSDKAIFGNLDPATPRNVIFSWDKAI